MSSVLQCRHQRKPLLKANEADQWVFFLTKGVLTFCRSGQNAQNLKINRKFPYVGFVSLPRWYCPGESGDAVFQNRICHKEGIEEVLTGSDESQGGGGRVNTPVPAHAVFELSIDQSKLALVMDQLHGKLSLPIYLPHLSHCNCVHVKELNFFIIINQCISVISHFHLLFLSIFLTLIPSSFFFFNVVHSIAPFLVAGPDKWIRGPWQVIAVVQHFQEYDFSMFFFTSFCFVSLSQQRIRTRCTWIRRHLLALGQISDQKSYRATSYLSASTWLNTGCWLGEGGCWVQPFNNDD